MRLIVTNPALNEALEAQGKDWTTFTRQEMRKEVLVSEAEEKRLERRGKRQPVVLVPEIEQHAQDCLDLVLL